MRTRYLVTQLSVALIGLAVGSGCEVASDPTSNAATARPTAARSLPRVPATEDLAATLPHRHADVDADDERWRTPLHPSEGDPRSCTCGAARRVDGWCEHHSIGWVAGTAVPSAFVFETLDPHGHIIDHASLSCDRCRECAARNGACSDCRIWWHRGLAYMTRLPWLLAQGQRVSPSRATPSGRCEDCRLDLPSLEPALRWNFSSSGSTWCPQCQTGRVGTVFFADPLLYDAAARAHGTLIEALAERSRCELCACAIVYDGSCPDCGVAYRSGRRFIDPEIAGRKPN